MYIIGMHERDILGMNCSCPWSIDNQRTTAPVGHVVGLDGRTVICYCKIKIVGQFLVDE